MICRIYALVDPTNNEVRYIGQTTNPLNRRLSQHLWDQRNSHRAAWINSLKQKELKPKIVLIEEGEWTQEECDQKEIFWISWGRENFSNLTNHANGGSVNYLSEETRQMHSERMKRWHKENPGGVRQPGFTHSEETRTLLSQKAKEQWSDPENRKKKSEQMKLATKNRWDNYSDQQKKDHGHKTSLGRRYLYATRRGLALEVIS